MNKYTVKKVADLSGVSVRTLQYYDKIGLLSPAERAENGYRIYGRQELVRLQQILLYRRLEIPLKEISEIINNPRYDLQISLEQQKYALTREAKRIKRLLKTVENTINELKTKRQMMTDEEIYQGFKPEKIKAVRLEIEERWGKEDLKLAEENIRNLGVKRWHDAKQQEEEINRTLAKLMDYKPHEIIVQKAIEQHYKYLNNFYEVSKERYAGLGKMYTEDPRFKQHYEAYREGLSGFINQAIQEFCQNDLKVKAYKP